MKTILVDGAYCFTIEKDGKFEIFQDMYNLLETYPNKKIILTGANAEQREKFNLNNVPYPLFTLEHNPEKTDPKYFEILLKKYNLENKDVVYFEHNPESIKGAKLAGIDTYFYDNDKKNLVGLKKFLDDSLK